LGAPGSQISIDLIGKLPKTADGYEYVLTAQDKFSKLVMIEKLRDKTALNTAKGLLRIFLRHGFYPVCHSDQGQEFLGEVTAQLQRLIGTQRSTSISLMPRQNLVERSHRYLHSLIAKTVELHKNWSEVIDFAVFAMNSTVNRSTGFTAHFLHFGRELPSAIETLLSNPTTEDWESYGEFARNIAERMQKGYLAAREVLEREAIAAKKYYDSRVKLVEFSENDRVLVYNPRWHQRTFPKWRRSFGTEAVIVQKLNDITFRVKFLRSGKFKIVHSDKMKMLQRHVDTAAGASN
jgi:hypothetical protein